MSNRYHPTRPGSSYLARIAEEWNAQTVLAPDITTERAPLAPTPPAPPIPPAAASAERKAHDGATVGSVVEARHPEIIRAIGLLWGYPELNEYFDRLWLAEGNLGPIDPDAMSELMLLSRIHQTIVPHRPGRSLASFYGPQHDPDKIPRRTDPWRDVPPRR